VRRFKFNLEKLLELREYAEREAEIALGRAIGLLRSIELEIEDTAQKRFEAGKLRFVQGADTAEIRAADLYILRLDQKRDRLLSEAAAAQSAVDEAREAWTAASRDKKIIDKLREKRLAEYKKAAAKEEVSMIDDIYSTRASLLVSQ
jgi:flagellar FliJ protein